MKIHHEFSCEIDPIKRQFILDAHTQPGSKPRFHLYRDVKVFEAGEGFCEVCNCCHAVQSTVDLLFAGPSCKNLSLMNKERKNFVDCYETGDGCSGFTYQHGVIDAIKVTSPAVLYFENVVGVAQSRQVKKGEKTTPAIQARYMNIYDIFI